MLLLIKVSLEFMQDFDKQILEVFKDYSRSKIKDFKDLQITSLLWVLHFF